MQLITVFLMCLMGAILLMSGIGVGGWKIKQANQTAVAPRDNVPSTVDPGNAAPSKLATPDEPAVH